MRNYTQLAREPRYQISALLKTGQSQTQIARVIGVDKSTISRELKRNTGRRGYRPKQSDAKAQARKDKIKVRISQEQWELVEQWLRLDRSPQ